MNNKRTTVKDIAERMGISLSTVNKALTGKPGISEKRRAEVIGVAKEMGYVVNHVAQSLSRNPIKIGVILPSSWQHFFELVERGARIEFEKLAQENVQGFFKYIENSSDIKGAFDFFYEMNVDIIIYCVSMIQVPEYMKAYVCQKKVPTFIVGDECKEIDSVCSIVVDAELSGRMAADFLKLLLNDGDEVAVFIGTDAMGTHASKAKAFVERAKDIGLAPIGVFETLDDWQVAKTRVEEMNNSFPRVKGIYVATAIATAITQYYSEKPEATLPRIVATDVYADIDSEMKKGSIAAAIFQNQVVMGRLAVKMAYRYFVETTSYNAFKEEFSKEVYIIPQLLLPSNLERQVLDSGSNYTLI